jgi:ketosteroid isomerase-like protein
MSDGPALLTRFYRAFGARDADAMAACYTPDVHFSDPVFPDLRGARAGAMWRMLCSRATDLRIAFEDPVVIDHEGAVHWEAWYTYSATRRPVHNIIEARFTLRDGLIAEHRDSFTLYRWARQALGLTGMLLGWSPPVQRAIRDQAATALDRYIATASAKPGRA